MSKNNQFLSAPVIAAVIFGGSYLARKGIAQAWTGVTKQPAPPEQDNTEVELGEAVAWAVVTGVAVGVLRFAFRRANYRGSPLE